MSTICIGDRTFPTVGLICPPVDGDESTEWSRSLGMSEGDTARFVVAENGILFEVTPSDDGWSLNLYTPTCWCYERDPDGPLWLPRLASIIDGALVALDPNSTEGQWNWTGCEDWWLVEFIDRLSAMPFTIPDGPRVRFVDADADIDGKPIPSDG